MAKAVYRPLELEVIKDRMPLKPPEEYELAYMVQHEEEVEEAPEEDVYEGPTADDLRQEAEAFKEQWKKERETMVQSARAEAERIVQEAEETAASRIEQKTEEGLQIKNEAEKEAERIVAQAGENSKKAEADSKAVIEAQKKDAEEKGYDKGKEAGFAEGKAEVDRLIERTRIMLERAQDKRAEILAETEQEIVDLVLLMTRKVVKAISESQRTVVVSNVVQALRKIKSRGNIFIRVNMADLKLSTEHIKDFIKLVEGAKSVQVVEDSTVDSGGCIIETDFGEIDARISSQLAELEAKILEISPISSRTRPSAKPEGA